MRIFADSDRFLIDSFSIYRCNIWAAGIIFARKEKERLTWILIFLMPFFLSGCGS